MVSRQPNGEMTLYRSFVAQIDPRRLHADPIDLPDHLAIHSPEGYTSIQDYHAANPVTAAGSGSGNGSGSGHRALGTAGGVALGGRRPGS
jgi:hypothetical protein